MEWNKHTANSSFKEVVIFIDYFYKKLIEKIKEKYNVINLDLPIVCNMKSDVNLLNNNRVIDFDNYNDKNIYEIIYEPDNIIRYYCWFLELTNNDVVVSKYKQINRDAMINNSSSIENIMLNFEFFILEEQKKEGPPYGSPSREITWSWHAALSWLQSWVRRAQENFQNAARKLHIVFNKSNYISRGSPRRTNTTMQGGMIQCPSKTKP